MVQLNFYLNPKQSTYLKQSLVHYGIMLQNNKINVIKNNIDKSMPYYCIDEGIICSPDLCKIIREGLNVNVYLDGVLVVQKSTNNIDPLQEYHQGAYDLYDEDDNSYVRSKIHEWETGRKIYLFNTEELDRVISAGCIAGLASGHVIASLAFENSISQVIYFDYSERSLQFQKDMILSRDRISLIRQNREYLTLGDKDPTDTDIDSIDIGYLDKIYDSLRDKQVSFHHIDMRKHSDIACLIDQIPYGSTLWISNVYHYITSLNDYDRERYDLLDDLCESKNINLLPYTRVYYEG